MDARNLSNASQFDAAFNNIEKKEGVTVWRINNFKLESINQSEYGHFFNGDSYIVLRATKIGKSSNMDYDIFFWIGNKSTDDEIGTAAYKAVELDTYLKDVAVQHREVEGYETSDFKSCFKDFIVLNGGVQTGFNMVEIDNYKPRLLKFHYENKTLCAKEVPYCIESITSDDVYVIDNGVTLFQYNGATANKDERRLAGEFLRKLKDSRKNCEVEIIDESSEGRDHPSLKSLPSLNLEKTSDNINSVKRLVRLSDEGGMMKYNLVQENKISFSKLDLNDAFFIYTANLCFVWVGSKASVEEKRLGLTYAHKYMRDNNLGFKPIVVFREGQETSDFKKSFDN